MIRSEMPEQPSGTVTLVFTDVEGATRLLADLVARLGCHVGRLPSGNAADSLQFFLDSTQMFLDRRNAGAEIR